MLLQCSSFFLHCCSLPPFAKFPAPWDEAQKWSTPSSSSTLPQAGSPLPLLCSPSLYSDPCPSYMDLLALDSSVFLPTPQVPQGQDSISSMIIPMRPRTVAELSRTVHCHARRKGAGLLWPILLRDRLDPGQPRCEGRAFV